MFKKFWDFACLFVSLHAIYKKMQAKMNNIYKIILCTALLLAAFTQTAHAAKQRIKQQSTYMAGIAISFTDSMVFITDLQRIDSVTIEQKRYFLMDRQLYGMQLQNYLQTKHGGEHYVTAICFGKKKKKMERRYLALCKQYTKRADFRVTLIDQSQFRFHAEEYIYTPDESVGLETQKSKKKSKK